jgi:hypothetical protein
MADEELNEIQRELDTTIDVLAEHINEHMDQDQALATQQQEQALAAQEGPALRYEAWMVHGT